MTSKSQEANMGKDQVEVMLILPPHYEGDNKKGNQRRPNIVPFSSVPREGDWVEWGARPRRVLGVVWGGAQDDELFTPRVYLEDAPLDLHPQRLPQRLWKPKDFGHKSDD